MPLTLADLSKIERTTFSLGDRDYRLKASRDLSLNDSLELSRAALNPQYILLRILYDPLPAPVSDKVAVAICQKFYEGLIVQDAADSTPAKTSGAQEITVVIGGIIPPLQAAFGYIGKDWMDVPQWKLEMYLDAVPGIQANSLLNWVPALQVGAGLVKKSTARTYQREWRRVSRNLYGRDSKTKVRSKAEFEGLLAQMGIDFQEVGTDA